MKLRSSVLTLGLVCLSIQATIPAGFMAGSVVDGVWFRLCPGGLPKAFLQSLGGQHAQHHHGAHHTEELPDVGQCDMNVPLDAASTLSFNPPCGLVLTAVNRLAGPLSVLATGALSGYRPRGPPTNLTS